ncbi:MAG: lipid kinase YegS, partial [Gemmatimonadota bacterium]
FHLLAIGNGRYAGGGMPLCPRADPTDGAFDVTIVPEGTVGETLAEVVRNGVKGIGEAGIRFRAPWVELRAEERLQINLDGEPASGARFRFEVLPGALRALLPGDSPIVETRGPTH